MKSIYTHIALAITILATSCQSNNPTQLNSTIHVAIAPLATIVERITCEDFPVEVIVPSGASVESYELTPKQFISINKSQMIFTTGLLSFERSILKKIEQNNGSRMVNLSRGIELIEGSCSHHSHEHEHHHSHGVDPHIWTSPRELIKMSQNCFDAVTARYPDSLKYRKAYIDLIEELRALDEECQESITQNDVKSIFIYHPALTYYARAYGIEQVAIESEGKEPSAKRLAEMIERGREENVHSILYQREYPKSSVEIVAEDLGAEAVEIDPLDIDPLRQIRIITQIICGGDKR